MDLFYRNLGVSEDWKEFSEHFVDACGDLGVAAFTLSLSDEHIANSTEESVTQDASNFFTSLVGFRQPSFYTGDQRGALAALCLAYAIKFFHGRILDQDHLNAQVDLVEALKPFEEKLRAYFPQQQEHQEEKGEEATSEIH